MKILAIEDNSEDAQFLRACLGRQSFKAIELTQVSNVKDALASMAAQAFDVILLDLNLPDASGHECVEKVQHASPETPIVVLSGQGDEDYAVEILNRGVQDYLGKWEGDGFVVTTAGFNDKGWLDNFGKPATDALRVTERFRRKDFGHMDVEITIDDPKAYTRPWSVTLPLVLEADTELLEYICNENNRYFELVK